MDSNDTYTVVIHKGVSCPSEKLSKALASLKFPSKRHEAHILVRPKVLPGDSDYMIIYKEIDVEKSGDEPIVRCNEKLANILVGILDAMQKQGVVRMDVIDSGATAKFTVTGADTNLVYVEKDTTLGYTRFQMYLIASPNAEVRVRTDEAGHTEVTVESTDYNRSAKYVFTVVQEL